MGDAQARRRDVSALPWWPWWGALLIAAALGVAALVWALTELRRWREVHHAWWGLILIGYGLTGRGAVGYGMAVVGLLVLLDDAQAHVRQALDPAFPRSGVRGWRDAAYSPLHWAAKKLGLI